MGILGRPGASKRASSWGRPDDPETWAKLDEMVFDRTFRFGEQHWPASVHVLCGRRRPFHPRCTDAVPRPAGQKGVLCQGLRRRRPALYRPAQKAKDYRGQGSGWYLLAVPAGRRFWKGDHHGQPQSADARPQILPLSPADDYGSAYFKGLLSETKVYDPNKRHPWAWKKIPGHERNEPLDCRNYALAAFKVLPVNLDAIDHSLKLASGKAVPQPVATPAAAVPRPAAKKRRGTNRFLTIGDEYGQS